MENMGNIDQEISNPDTRKPKTMERTSLEQGILAKIYPTALRSWQENREALQLPDEITEDFILVGVRKSSIPDLPVANMEFLSSYGAIKLYVWDINPETRTIVTSKDIYTQGSDGKVRGKGRQAVQNIQAILQSLSDHTGYKVVEMVTPNQKSAPHFTEETGYKDFDPDEYAKATEGISQENLSRWNFLMKDVLPYPSKIRRYEPRAKDESASTSGEDSVQLKAVRNALKI
jgi:hypothetical protein